MANGNADLVPRVQIAAIPAPVADLSQPAA
jgi:hypothetical protein